MSDEITFKKGFIAILVTAVVVISLVFSISYLTEKISNNTTDGDSNDINVDSDDEQGNPGSDFVSRIKDSGRNGSSIPPPPKPN